MKVTDAEIKQLLIDDLEMKKPFPAKWEAECSLCGNEIPEGDDIYFFGDKQKVCNDCRDLMRQTVEDKL